MIIDCISDLHGYVPTLAGGDLLILGGDYTGSDKLHQWWDFFSWLKQQPYTKKILIAGNHDNLLETGFPKSEKEARELAEVREFFEEEKEDFEYLCDSGTEFNGVKIWGSPWTQWFHGVNPACKAFMLSSEKKLAKKWSLIPEDTNILITHSPPFGILDQVESGYVGSLSLRNKVLNEGVFPNLNIHIFGHIHEQGGKILDTDLTKFVNASYVNEHYRPVNKPIRIVL